MYKILLAGCGNIGALYDFDNDQILTHAKAFALHNSCELTVFDKDIQLAQKVGQKYRVGYLTHLDIDLSYFDCISICTPTSVHFNLLIKSFQQKVKLVLCEKPVSAENNELILLTELYKKSETKVLVNYFRRFLPAYDSLKNWITENLSNEQLTSIAIRYQRGFVNNCSHALDLIQFLTAKSIELTNIQKHNAVFDSFDNDPTLSMQATWGSTLINILGLANVKFSHFEIDLFFEYHKIAIKNAGDVIEIYAAESGGRFFSPLIIKEKLSNSGCLKNYMEPVAGTVVEILQGNIVHDNFLESVNLNLKMLEYLKK